MVTVPLLPVVAVYLMPGFHLETIVMGQFAAIPPVIDSVSFTGMLYCLAVKSNFILSTSSSPI
jgi:hypothetical protein